MGNKPSLDFKKHFCIDTSPCAYFPLLSTKFKGITRFTVVSSFFERREREKKYQKQLLFQCFLESKYRVKYFQLTNNVVIRSNNQTELKTVLIQGYISIGLKQWVTVRFSTKKKVFWFIERKVFVFLWQVNCVQNFNETSQKPRKFAFLRYTIPFFHIIFQSSFQ